MPGRSPLEEAWRGAQSSLEAIQMTLRSSESCSHRVMRVGQLDSEILDKDLASLVQEPLNKALTLISTSLKTRVEPEISLLIQLVLYKLSIWDTGASYGAKLQDLRYVIQSTHGTSTKLSPSGIPRRALLAHGALTLLIPYLHTRIRSYALSHAWPDAPSSDRRRKTWNLLTALESWHSSLSLFSFVAFMWDGRYRTISDRLLNMTLVPARRLVRRDVSYEFMNRQMVWHAFTEFLLFLLPLINARSIQRRINRLSSAVSVRGIIAALPPTVRSTLGISVSPSTPSDKPACRRGKYWALPPDQCAICAEDASFNLIVSEPSNTFTSQFTPANVASPEEQLEASPESEAESPAFPLNTSYVTSCGDVYCYHCIAGRLLCVTEEGEAKGWQCLRCGKLVQSAERFVVGNVSEQVTSDYDFSDMDMDDMSTSIGSGSEFSAA